ncbi:MAG: hypothetical protein ACI9YL_001241 [Luteibaculaceae bacterium]|jgi:hypothetical protein
MEINLTNLNCIFPENLDLHELKKEKTTKIFHETAILFLDRLSKKLLEHEEARLFPDVSTFGFFCRKANILKIQRQYDESEIRVGRGITFHISPSNVPLNFAYSLISGLLSGNINIVRLPSNNFRQVEIIAEAIKAIALKKEFTEVTKRIVLLQYQRGSDFTQLFSSICDIRVIWGGDTTVNQIRESPLKAKAYDITFVDRYSFCIIRAEELVKKENLDGIIKGFYNDTYLLDQNACTSPHLIIWQGEDSVIKVAKEKFWSKLKVFLEEKNTETPPVVAINKLVNFYRQAMDLSEIKLVDVEHNSLWRVDLKKKITNLENYRCTSGYFSELNVQSLADIEDLINEKYQTLSYFGFSKEELSAFISDHQLPGIDRVVPIGQTLDFNFKWDGFDLIYQMSRTCTVR